MSVIKLISETDATSVIKEYFKDYIEDKMYEVDVTEANADLQKLIRELPAATMETADHDCIIGYWQVCRSRLMTLDDLKRQNAEDWYNYKFCCKNYGGGACKKPLTLLQEIDGRRNDAGLKKFSFCPICGKQIDWQKIKKEVLEIERSYTD